MTITINGTTGIAGVDGSAATPSVQGTDTNTGVFFPANDVVGIATNGTEKVRVASAGQVGIGGANYGTSGQVLTSGGAAAAPSWATPSTGAWVLIQTQTASASSTIDFTGLSGYSRLRLTAQNITASAATSDHSVRLSSDNGVTYIATTTYNNMNAFATTLTNTGYQESLLDSQFVLMMLSQGTRTGLAYEFNITNFNQALPTQLVGWSTRSSGTAPFKKFVMSDQTGSTVMNAIRIFQSTGTITTGTFILEGIVG